MKNEITLTKFQFLVSIVLTLFVTITGFTYAYFALSESDSETVNGSAATVNLTLSVEKKFPLTDSENTGVLVPQLSSTLDLALKNGCIDDNKNIICQVYEIVIKNVGGTATQVVDGSVSFYGNPAMTFDVNSMMPNLKWKLITSVDVASPGNSVLGGNADLIANYDKNIFANDIVLKTNDEYSYYMIVWINETNDEQPLDEGSSFYGKIEFNSANGTGVTSTFTP